MQQVDGAHLRFRNAVRAAEIELDRGSLPFPFLDILEDCVDFLLRKLSAQNLSPELLSAVPRRTLGLAANRHGPYYSTEPA
jgi:hypothetical protein